MKFDELNMELAEGYRIVEVKNGVAYTLFHGNNGTRQLRYDSWMQSRQTKFVRDGGHKWYRAGWHVMANRELAEEYLKRFKKPRDIRVIKVFYEACPRTKPTNPNIFLTEWLYIPGEQFDE